jgi:hypothetical protein
MSEISLMLVTAPFLEMVTEPLLISVASAPPSTADEELVRLK